MSSMLKLGHLVSSDFPNFALLCGETCVDADTVRRTGQLADL